MKTKLSLLLIIIVFALFSCSKDEEPTDKVNKDTTSSTTTSETKEEVRYYVKYELSAYYPVFVNYHLSISYSDVKGAKAIGFEEGGNGKTWEGTYGPFKKNDHVFLSCIVNKKMDITAKISVSRNDEPFAIKAETKQESENCKIEYTIDY